jgi:hypothetical protein
VQFSGGIKGGSRWRRTWEEPNVPRPRQGQRAADLGDRYWRPLNVSGYQQQQSAVGRRISQAISTARHRTTDHGPWTCIQQSGPDQVAFLQRTGECRIHAGNHPLPPLARSDGVAQRVDRDAALEGLTAGDEPVLRGRKLAELSGYLHTRSVG